MNYLHQIPRIRDGLECFLEKDPVFKKSGIALSEIGWPYMGPGFPGLARIIVGQQVSMQAAQTIWARVEKSLPCVTPNAILALKDDDMRALGLSHQKASYIRNLAQAVREGIFNPDALEDASDEEVFKAVTALKGLGGWSAQMYLMFGLARPDIWAPGDLGIQEGLRVYLKKKTRPSPEQTEKYGARFAPHRTAACLLLWRLKAKMDEREKP
ncbi:MAG: DNA-3-methyladenine glycosylase 2 family protein [Proteobacteria bacterium]|nr:DNA-3-methyladenine glycosylase 2 family protein [Pseudomonadota bacterium]